MGFAAPTRALSDRFLGPQAAALLEKGEAELSDLDACIQPVEDKVGVDLRCEEVQNLTRQPLTSQLTN